MAGGWVYRGRVTQSFPSSLGMEECPAAGVAASDTLLCHIALCDAFGAWEGDSLSASIFSLSLQP